MNQFVCKKCKATYLLDDPRWKCDCNSILDIEFESIFDIEKIKSRKPTMWRYREALPINNDENIVSFDEGYMPLIEIKIENKRLFVKLEQLFPTGSYKDRGASLLISKAKELGMKRLVEDSSGNAGCAIAAYSAKAGIECNILVPESISPEKLTQIQIYGANLHRISGTREDVAHATLDSAKNIFYAGHSCNPFFFKGLKRMLLKSGNNLASKLLIHSSFQLATVHYLSELIWDLRIYLIKILYQKCLNS